MKKTLSEKRSLGGNGDYWEKDVKQFIKEVLEETRKAMDKKVGSDEFNNAWNNGASAVLFEINRKAGEGMFKELKGGIIKDGSNRKTS